MWGLRSSGSKYRGQKLKNFKNKYTLETFLKNKNNSEPECILILMSPEIRVIPSGITRLRPFSDSDKAMKFGGLNVQVVRRALAHLYSIDVSTIKLWFVGCS